MVLSIPSNINNKVLYVVYLVRTKLTIVVMVCETDMLTITLSWGTLLVFTKRS